MDLQHHLTHMRAIQGIRAGMHQRGISPKGGSGPPDGGDDGGNGPDKDEEDDDEKIGRRMIKFLGGFVDQKGDDKPKAKKTDTIKVPAFPLAETYRNWRIKTREAVVAASTDPDSAFKWVSESWKEDQTLEALREGCAVCDVRCQAAICSYQYHHR